MGLRTRVASTVVVAKSSQVVGLRTQRIEELAKPKLKPCIAKDINGSVCIKIHGYQPLYLDAIIIHVFILKIREKSEVSTRDYNGLISSQAACY